MVDVCIPLSNAEIAAWCERNLNIGGQECVVGFDCEWKPAWTKGEHNRVAIVQIATPSSVLLVQLRRLLSSGDGNGNSTNSSSGSTGSSSSGSSTQFPEALAALINNSKVVKTGVGVLEDLKLLQSDYGVKFAGFLELSAAADRLLQKRDGQQYRQGRPLQQKIGLKNLAKRFLAVDVDKPKKVQMGNWERLHLSDEQVQYACYDALLAVDVHSYLEENGTFDGAQRQAFFGSAEITCQLRRASRETMRSLWAHACEDSDMLRTLTLRLVQEDAAWLRDFTTLAEPPTPLTTTVDDPAAAPRRPCEGASWRGALALVLSRFGFMPTYKYIKPDSASAAGQKASSEVTMELYFHGGKYLQPRFLATGRGFSKREAGEAASKQALRMFLELQQRLVRDHDADLVSLYAGKDPLPRLVEDWLEALMPAPDGGRCRESIIGDDASTWERDK